MNLTGKNKISLATDVPVIFMGEPPPPFLIAVLLQVIMRSVPLLASLFAVASGKAALPRNHALWVRGGSDGYAAACDQVGLSVNL